jgi:hypothetical protein
MFRASSRPSSGAQQLQYQPLVLPSERGDSSAVGRGRRKFSGRRPKLPIIFAEILWHVET